MTTTTKTTCGAHRIVGYHLAGGVWVCRECGEAQSLHETFAETIARREAEAAVK